jgi:DNA processing protein
MVKGDKNLLYQNSIAIVGARNASLNGNKLTYLIAKKLGEYGWKTISGMARGIDKSAHEGSLSSGTIAVVAGGIDVIYPEENQKLYEQICEQGVIVSECAMGIRPQAQSFPRRNRLISALSKGVLIVEASLQSGSMITAENALDQGRDVFAVPGSPLDPRCRGPNKLIKQGAKLVESAEDILANLMEFSEVRKKHFEVPDLFDSKDFPSSAMTRKVMENLGGSSVSIEVLAEASSLTLREISSILTDLELEEKIIRHPGGRVSLRLQA